MNLLSAKGDWSVGEECELEGAWGMLYDGRGRVPDARPWVGPALDFVSRDVEAVPVPFVPVVSIVAVSDMAATLLLDSDTEEIDGAASESSTTTVTSEAGFVLA